MFNNLKQNISSNTGLLIRLDDIAKARPKMIEFLDSLRHTLEELSPDLGVTDPHSGTVIIEK